MPRTPTKATSQAQDTTMATGTSNLPAVINTLAIAQMDVDTIVEVLQESGVDGDGISPFDLDRIPFPLAGSISYAVPTEEGRKVPMETLEVVILHHHLGRQFYEGEYDATNPTAPRCSSSDAIVGFGDPGGECRTCPFGQFNCGCKQYRFLYILFPQENMPRLLILPRTSLNGARKYLKKQALSGVHIYQRITKIGLADRKTGAGVVATFTPGPVLSPEMGKVAQAYARAFRSSLVFPKMHAGGAIDPTAGEAVAHGANMDDDDDDDIEY